MAYLTFLKKGTRKFANYNQVGNSVDDDQMDAPVQVVVLVHALDDGGQPLVPRHPRQAVHVQVRRHFLPTGTPQQPPRVLVELLLALFRVYSSTARPFRFGSTFTPRRSASSSRSIIAPATNAAV